MTTKSEFNADEWSQVAAGPFVAGLTVIAADRGGTVRETFALARAIADEQKSGDNPELISELLRDRPDPQSLFGEGSTPPTAENVPVRAEQVLRDGLSTLEAKATDEEVQAYKQVCLEVAQRVAERTKSGGVLGIGGEKVSGEEQQALDHLRSILSV